MTVWWRRDKRRFLREVWRIKKLIELPWFAKPLWRVRTESSQLWVTFDLFVHNRWISFYLIYHEAFPDCPPSVYPLHDKRLSSHQYGPDGELCLQIRNDNWLPAYMGADMIESAYRLLQIESPDESGSTTTAPSDHKITFAESIRNLGCRFYLTSSQHKLLTSEVAHTSTIELSIRRSIDDHAVAKIASATIGKETSIFSDVPQGLGAESYKKSATFLKTNANFEAVCKAVTYRDMTNLIGDQFRFEDEHELFLIVLTSDKHIVLLHYHQCFSGILRYVNILDTDVSNRTGHSLSGPRNMKVGIVGVGSIGSKVAVSLTRSAVKNFELVDGDLLYAGNLARHDGDYRDLGFHKVDAVNHRMHLIQPNLKVRTWNTNLGTQQSSARAAQLIRALAECEIIIDATADARVFNRLAGLALRSRSVLIWGSVFAGGIGGEIARFRPSIDPSPYDIRAALSKIYPENIDEIPQASEDKYSGLVVDTPIVGTDSAVSTIASHMSALALDTLLNTKPTSFEAQAYLIGLRKAWFFDGPFDTRPIIVEKTAGVQSCQPTAIRSDEHN